MDDVSVLADAASMIGMAPLTPREGVVHGWGDMEVAFAVERDGDGFLVRREDRGRSSVMGRFPELTEADAFLLMILGSIWRTNRGLGDPFPAEPAPGAVVERLDAGGYRVDAHGYSAVVASRVYASRYAHVAGSGMQAVAELLLA